MAGYPNYPPPPGNMPFGADARAQRRLFREQARAAAQQQKLAFQMRREQMRQQARASRRTSIVGPVLLVALGVLLLLVKLGTISRSAALYAYGRWWPLLLVGTGLVLLAEWALDQRTALPGAPTGRRSLGGGAVLLLVLLSVGGAVASGVREGMESMRGFAITPDNVGQFFGEKHESEQRLDDSLPAGSSFVVENPHGDITVNGTSGDGEVHISVDRTVYGFGDGDAADKAAAATVRLERSGSSVRLVVPRVDGATSNLTITLPESAAATLKADRGEIRADNLKAPLTLTAGRGDVELNHIEAEVTARLSSRSSSFTAHGVTGAVTISGTGGDMTLTDIGGRVALDGDFYGDTHFERLAGPVEFTTSRTQFSLAALPGSVDISSGSDLSGTELAGPVRLKTRSRNVTFDGVTGDVTVGNSNGPVEVSRTTPGGNISVDNTNGEVRVKLPERAGLNIAAETRGGSISNEFGLVPNTEGSRNTLNGRVGDGASRIDLRTTHADIAVERTVATTAPAPPPPPAAVAPPAKPAARPHTGKPNPPLTPTPTQP